MSLTVNPKTELLALKRASINKGYKCLTIREAYRLLIKLESSHIHRHINNQLDIIERRKLNANR